MARKTIVTTVGADTYELTQIGAVEAYDLYNELVAALGPKISERIGALQELARKKELSEADTGMLILELKAAVPRQLMRDMREAFARGTRVKTGSVLLQLSEGDIFDQHFAGRMTAIDQWMIACMKHNFMGFLGERANSGERPQDETPSE